MPESITDVHRVKKNDLIRSIREHWSTMSSLSVSKQILLLLLSCSAGVNTRQFHPNTHWDLVLLFKKKHVTQVETNLVTQNVRSKLNFWIFLVPIFSYARVSTPGIKILNRITEVELFCGCTDKLIKIVNCSIFPRKRLSGKFSFYITINQTTAFVSLVWRVSVQLRMHFQYSLYLCETDKITCFEFKMQLRWETVKTKDSVLFVTYLSVTL